MLKLLFEKISFLRIDLILYEKKFTIFLSLTKNFIYKNKIFKNKK